MMAHMLVVFGTTDGQTAKIARFVREALVAEGHVVDLIDSRDPAPGTPLQGVEAAIIAGSVRMGKFQKPLIAFVRQHREALAKIPTVFIAVSLSAGRDSAAAKREVTKTITGFVEATGFRPGTTLPVAGALVYSRYGFFTRLAMILISKMAGGDTDTSRDYEYTDWRALSAFAHDFGRSACAAA